MDRFDHLEHSGELPESVAKAVEGLHRFHNLEIGGLGPAEAPVHEPNKVLCPHCGEFNERERADCWACGRLLAAKAAAPKAKAEETLTIVLDGVTYKSTDQGLPADIATLMARIRKEGYSPQLLADWQNWRVTRNAERRDELAAAHGKPGEVEVFTGRTTVLRVDDKILRSNDPDLPPEIKELFKYISEHGVTPALMETLRKVVPKAKLRPSGTADPSEGDVAFWEGLAKSGDLARMIAQRQADLNAIEGATSPKPKHEIQWWFVALVVGGILSMLLL